MAYIGKRPVDTFPAINAVTSTLIAENNITAREIATNTIVTLLIADNAITSVKIAENNITTREIAQNTIATGNIADNAVDGTKIAQNSILTRHIDDAQVTVDQLATDSITTVKIADDQVTLDKMAALARGKLIYGNASGNPAALAIGTNGQALTSDGTDLVWGQGGKTTEEIQDIAGAMFSSNTETNITATYEDGDGTIDLVVGTLNQDTSGTAALATSITASANNSTNETVYPTFVDGATGTQGLETDTGLTYNPSTGMLTTSGVTATITGNVTGNVTGNASGTAATVTGGTQAAITSAANLVTVGTIGTGVWQGTAIASGYIAADAITGAKIADDAINSEHYTDGSIDTAHIAASQITNALMADDAIDSAEIADGAIDTAHIADDQVTAAKLANTAVTAAAYGSSSAIPVITVDAQGRITAASTAATSSVLTIAADSGSNDTVTVGTDTLTFEGTTNEIETTVSNNKINIGLPTNVTIAGNLTVAGTQTTVSSTTITVADPLVSLATSNNAADAVDIGIYGLYDTSGSQDLYSGLFRDASDSGKWKLFKDNQAAPTTTVNTGGTGYATGTLVANLEGNVTGNVTGNTSGTALTVTQAAQSAITSLGTLTTLTVDNLNINGNTITAGSGAVNITPAGGSAIVLDGTINVDAGVVTGATSITSTAFVGGLTGNVTGNTSGTAATVTGGTQAAITSTANLVTVGTIGTGVWQGTAIASGYIAADAITGAKIADDAIDSEHYTDGSIDTAHIADDQVTLAKMAGIARGKVIYGDASGNPAVLALGSNGQVLKSDGTDIAWAADSGLSTEEVQDIAGAMFSSNTETGIAATYQDGDGTIDLVIGAGSIVNSMLADDAVGADELAVNSVVSASIVNASIVGADIAANTITVTNIADDAVESDKIANNAILTQHIDDNQITGDQLADDLVLSGTGSTRLPDGTTAQRPGSGAAGMMRYNTTLGQFEGYTSGWVKLQDGGSSAFSTNTMTGDGSDVTLTLSQAPDSESDVIVFIDGVFQAHDTYAVSGTTLTFSTAPVSGRLVTAYHVKAAISGTNLTHDAFSGDGSDTTFTLSLAPVHENNTQVYVDGVYQFKSTYSVSGTTLTFSTAPPNGTAIEVMTMNQLDINVPVDDSVSLAKMAGITRGSIIYGNASADPAYLAIGSNGQVLKSDGTDIAWGTDATSSDYRLKRNVRPMQDGIERIKQLKPVKFRWKGDIEESEGFLAHEIQEAGWDVGVHGQKDGTEMQTVDYGRMTPLLVKALQEQQEKIEALEARLKAVEE